MAKGFSCFSISSNKLLSCLGVSWKRRIHFITIFKISSFSHTVSLLTMMMMVKVVEEMTLTSEKKKRKK